MPHRNKYARLAALAAALLLLYVIEDGILPEIFGAAPSLLISFTVAVGIFEGPFVAAGFGVAAGLLLDFDAPAFGFSALLLLVIGTAAGLIITYFRRTAGTTVVFAAVASAFFFLIRWFFMYVLWYGAGLWLPVLLRILYAVILTVPVYFLVSWICRRLGDEKEI